VRIRSGNQQTEGVDTLEVPADWVITQPDSGHVSVTPGGDHVMVFWAGLHGMYHNSACKTWITNCYFEDCGRAGVGDGINQPLGFLNVSYSYIHGNQGRGIFSSGAAALRLRDSDVNSNVGSGLFVQSTTNDLLVVGNRFTDNGSNANPQINLRNWNMGALTDAGVVITGNVFQEDRAAGSRCLTHLQTGGNPINARGVISGNAFLGSTFNGTPVIIQGASTGKNALVMDGNQGLNDTLGKITAPFTTNTVGIDGAATTATGVNALNSATMVVGSTQGFPSSGSFVMGGVTTTYTGTSSTSFTGCSNHAATTGGEAISRNIVVASTAYTVSCTDLYIVSSAGTGVSISILDPAGNTMQSGLATFAGTIPVGYSINFGAFSVAPTLVIAAC
jgi:hypothetical protein